MAAACRAQSHDRRRASKGSAAEIEKFLQQIAEEAQAVAKAHEYFPDERLKLLFVCAHPAIDSAARTPLMLQAVLGIDAARIASAFLVSPAAMSQRLVRRKIKSVTPEFLFACPNRRSGKNGFHLFSTPFMPPTRLAGKV